MKHIETIEQSGRKETKKHSFVRLINDNAHYIPYDNIGLQDETDHDIRVSKI